MKWNIGLTLIFLLCSGCSSGMARVCGIVEKSFNAGYSDVCEHATMIRMRENVCDCDSELKYEAFLYGQWRHVSITGSEESIKLMTQSVDEFGEYCFYMMNELYNSKHGQQFYQLRACDDSELKTLLSQ